MKEIPVTFKSHGKQIVGMLHLPSRNNAPVVIMCHGYFGSKEGAFYLFVDAARKFCKNGYCVLRFDYRGSGDSEGRFDDQRIKTMLEDFDAAINFLRDIEGIDITKIGVVGHSKGGTIAILSAIKHKNIKSLVTWSTIADYKGLWWDEESLKEASENGYTTKISFGYKTRYVVLSESFKYKMANEIKKLKVPIMFIHGNYDWSVPFSHSRLLFENANQPKRLIKIKNADHLFIPQSHRKKVISETLNWFKKWLK